MVPGKLNRLHFRCFLEARATALFLLANIIIFSAFSQPFALKVEHLTTEQGLSHNTVGSVYQDSKGFVWIGTIDGLNRFDGYSCIVFRNKASDSTTISSSFIHGVIEDADGSLWIGTRNGGLSRFNPVTGRFRNYLQNSSNETALTGNTVGPLFLDAHNVLWVGTEKGLGRFDRASDSFTQFRFMEPIASDDMSLAALAQATDSTLWMVTEKALYLFNPSSGKLQTQIHSLPTGKFYHGALVDKQQNLWIGSNTDGVFKMEPKSGTWKHYPARPESDQGVSSVYAVPRFADAEGDVWFTTQNGIDVFDLSTERFSHIRHSEVNPSSISNNNVSALMEDIHGDLWVGTWGGGVDKIVRSRMKFSVITAPGVLRNGFVLSLLQDSGGELWVGEGSGAVRFSLTNSKQIKNVMALPGLQSAVVWCMLEDTTGAVWLGAGGKGIVLFDKARRVQRIMKHENSNPASLPENTVRALFRDSRGRIWAGLQTKGAAWYDTKADAWHLIPSNAEDGRSISDIVVLAINEDVNGNMWFGTYVGGLNKFDVKTGNVTYYHPIANDSTSLSSNDVRGITITRSGEMWVATYGGGICRYDASKNSFQRFTERDGLPNDYTYGILEDNDGELWISTNKGLARFTPETKQFRSYTSRDGLQSDEFNTGAYFKSKSGQLSFGGINGVNYFYPNEIKGNTRVPPVVLTSFKIFDKELLGGRRLSTNDTITLQHADNFFSFEFAALDFVDASRNQYMYKLEGFDNDWIRAGSRRYASYTNLDPGEYVLHVRGSNSDGVWNEEGARLHVTIVPPFWQRWWFRGGAGLLLVVAFASVVRYVSTRKLRRQLQEMEKERALQRERERISRDLHDNAGAQLASIISGLEIVEEYMEHSGGKTKELIDSLRDDARSSMMRLRETIWALKTNAMTIDEFADAVRTYAERQLKYTNGIEIHVSSATNDTFTLSPNQVLNLYRIVQESIANALKHANAHTIDIEIKKSNGNLQLVVRDDGKGNPSAPDRFSGKGMMNMEKRAQELSGTFRFVATQESGSAVEVEIPIHPNELNRQ